MSLQTAAQDESPSEIDDLRRRLAAAETMLAAVRGDERELERRVADGTAVAQRRAHQLRALASQLTFTEQRERRRLAELIHDHLQQLLYAARLDLSAARQHTEDGELCAILARVDELLDQSIVQSRVLSFELSPPTLYAAGLKLAVEQLGLRMSQAYGLVVEVEAEPEADTPAEDIRILLFQSVRELLFNVVKHAGTPRATVRLTSTTEGRLRIVVADEGCGFDVRRLESAELGAAGFGMFNIRERLEFMGGTLEIESALGKGTRVTILAPPAESAPHVAHRRATAPVLRITSGEAADRAESSVRRIRVLLADDHRVLRQGLAHLLGEQPDFDVVGEASDGQEAVDMALTIRPDVVVMDVSMPALDGVEATRVLLAQLPAIRVIGLSMHEDEKIATAMYAAGAVCFLTKGDCADALVTLVRSFAPDDLR